MSERDAGFGMRDVGLWRQRLSVVRGLGAVVMLLVLASGARSQSAAPRTPAVRLYVLADTVALGEAFEVAVAADHAPGVQALFPEVPRGQTAESGPLLALGDAEVTDLRRFAPEASGGLRTDSVVYSALAFAADSARVGPLAVRFATGADTVTVASGVGLVRVRRLVPGPEAEPEPPAEPFPFPSPTPVWILLGVIALAAAALVGWGLWRLLRKPKRQALAPRPSPTPRPSLAWMHSAPRCRRQRRRRPGSSSWRMRCGRTWSGGCTYPRWSRRLARPTTRSRTGPRRRPTALRGVLRVCDRVKFADLRPGADAAGDALQRAREGVEAVEAHLAAQRPQPALPQKPLARRDPSPPRRSPPEAVGSDTCGTR